MAVDAMESTETTQTAVAGEGSPTEPAFGPLVIESLHRPWWNTFLEEVEHIFRPPPPLPPPPQYRDPLPGEPNLGTLMLEHLRRPWWSSIRSQTAELSELAKLPPLQVTSQPINVKSIWGGYDNKKRGLSTSAAIHVLIIILIFTVFRSGAPEARAGSVTLIIPVDITPYMAQLRQSRNQDKQGGGGGGGANAPLPPSKGRLPRFSMEQLTPPTPVIKNENPQLAVEPTVVVPPDAQIPQIDMAMFGDPYAKVGPPSAGPGSGGGIGTGTGGGVGSGSGAGVGPGSGGGFGGGVFRVGGGVSAPRLTRKVEPEYSEEARKAKYQGTVTLAVEVWPDGKAHNIRVLRSLGLGLDEKAVSAVQQWEFVPGKKDGRPVKVQATIEVNFRLL